MNTGHIETLEESLIKAVKAENRREVGLLLELHARLDRRDDHGLTVLHYAAELEDTGILEELLASPKAEPGITDDDKMTPLHYAARKNRVKAIALLRAKNANINAPDKWQATPLMGAAHNNAVESVKALLKYGADKDRQDEHKRTAVYYAASRGHVQATAALVDAGANVFLADHNNVTPLDLVRKFDQAQPSYFRIKQMLSTAEVQKHLKRGAGKPVTAPRTARFSRK